MKRILTFSAIAMIGLAVFSGCKKSSSTSYSMKATVGSTAFSVTNSYATLNGTNLAITGNSGSSTSASSAPYLTIVLSNYTAPGVYAIDTTLNVPVVDATWAADMTMADWKYSHTGSVTITSLSSSVVVGTFNFVCADGTTINSGTFSARRIN